MNIELSSIDDTFESYLRDKASMKNIPISGTFELLPTCNMDCKMCYVRMSAKEVETKGGLLPTEFWLDLANQAIKEGLLFLLLTGGEPLLYPGFFDLFRKLKDKGIILTLNTNGTLITRETALFFRDNMPRRINISIYGKDNETYRTLCNNPNGFSQLEKALHYLKEYNIPVKLNCSLTPYNYHQLDDMRRFAESMQVPIEIGYYMMPPNRKLIKDGYEAHRLTPELAAQMAYDIKMYGLSPEARKKLAREELSKTEGIDLAQKPKCGFWCRGGNSTFWVNWQGEMVPCGMLNKPVYDILQNGFKEAWKAMNKDTKEISLSSKCYYCEKRNICMHCAAAENAETGEFGKNPTYLCKLSQCYLELMEKEILL